ncbi:putative transcriptional regulatory protein C3C7.04 [Rhodotorula toruloides]|nr:putative transcriptional regulatory protein C3C7.04 [Rhodotorula toruloides]
MAHSLSPASTDSASPPSGAPAAKVPRTKRACVRCFQAKKSKVCYYDPEGNSRAKRPRRATPVDEPSAPIASTSTAVAPASGPSPTGKSEEDEDEAPVVVRQPFFRWLGLTSVMPPLQGAPFRSLSVTVQQPVTSPTNPPPVPPPPRDPAVESAEAEARVRTFYTLFESYLPYMPLVRPETPCPDPEELADRAKALVIAQLALPSLDTVYALILLAYHEHGADRDSGLWAYCGMAIRMCIDLGLHKPFETEDVAESNLRSRIFWTVTCLDRILSCGTGRATTIPLSQIEVGLPPPRLLRTSQGVDIPDPFPTLCRLLLILGNVSDAVNTTPSYATVPPRVPSAVQRQLADYQATLPPSLQFSIQTFGAYVSAGYAPVFLLLSAWHQAVHLAIHHAPLLYMQPGATMQDLTPLSGSPAVSIADMLAYSSVIADDAFLCTPVLSQPILMAGRAATLLLRTLSTTIPSTQLEPLERAVTVCQKTLERMQQRWRGLAWHVESMCKNAREVDLSGVGATIIMTDRGMFAKARLDDLARSCGWLLNELTAPASVFSIGVSSWGVSSQPATTAPPPQSTVAVHRSGRSSPLLWNDQSGGLDVFAEDLNGFLGIDWTAWQPEGNGLDGL